MSEKYSAWEQYQKTLHRNEIADRKAIKLKWQRRKQDQAILMTIPLKERGSISLKPYITS